MEAAKSAARTGKESVSDKTKFKYMGLKSVFVGFHHCFTASKNCMHINKLLLKWMNSYVLMAK